MEEEEEVGREWGWRSSKIIPPIFCLFGERMVNQKTNKQNK